VSAVTGTKVDVLVVGAGVIGLTTGIGLAEAGLRTVIWADQPPQQTTSAVAGAVWGPHLVEASDRVTRWSRLTLGVLREQAADPATGVRAGCGVQAAREPGVPVGDPGWAALLSGLRPAQPGELPGGYTGGWWYQAPLVHMPSYLAYLTGRFTQAGGRIEAVTVASLVTAAKAAGARAVVNCTGTGARDLAADPAVAPVSGQVAVVANPGLTEFFIGLPGGEHELVYVFPHGDVVVLGGTGGAGDWQREPDPAVSARILRDCALAVPRLRDAPVLAHRVGLRPCRPTVRLAAEPGAPGEPLVVHNYGHGGGGVTLAWGCAADVAALVSAALALSPPR
jgi:D-amino-acid oxidase